MSSWRRFADWAKHRPATLRLADRLGRGRGWFRMLDHLDAPPPAPLVPDLSAWQRHELAAVWLGHATVLLRLGGQTILTDPVFSHRVGITLGLITGGPRRLVAPALAINQLPPIDLIVLSHAHFDHLDRPTLERLPKTTPVVTAPETYDLIHDLGYRRVTELPWGRTLDVGSLRVTAREVKHWGARTFHDQHRGFNAYLIEADRRRVLYGGDSAYHTLFRDIHGVDLAILGIGAYDPYIAAHASPEQAWQMADHMRADHVMGIHHSTFRLSYEPDAEPLDRFRTAAGRDEGRVVASQIGGIWTEGQG